MSQRQLQKMFRLMGSGEPVELTSAMASVKKLARLAFIAEQFGYQYADVRQGGQGNSLKMLIVPDPSPQAQTRAAQSWAQYPQAGDGKSLPPFVPDALELLKARINFDLTGKSAEKRMGFGAIGVTVGMAIGVARSSGDGVTYVIGTWVLLLAILGIGFVVTRKRNAKFAARLQAAGFTPVADETGRVRYLPPGAQLPGHANPFAGQQHIQAGQGNPFAGQQQGQPTQAYGQQGQQGQPYGQPQQPYAPQQPYVAPQAHAPHQPYAPQQPHAAPQAHTPAPGPYGGQQAPAPGPYGSQPGQAGQPAPGPYAQPQPYAQPDNPYGQPQPPQH
ncbi:hypothetical protein [Streptomyces sp. NPDC048825]|uniref:hypothetical protein n=1 Tax=Streptomyces sp. NPDC048825 TaxID=3365592 RepID=UPI003721BBE6